MTTGPSLTLGIAGFSWADLHKPARLAELHGLFMAGLESAAPEVHARLVAYHACRGEGMTPDAVSNVIVDAAPHLGSFVARLFGVEAERQALMDTASAAQPIFRMKDQLVKRRALKRGPIAPDAALDAQARALLA